MPDNLFPGVYVEERDSPDVPIEGVSTSTAGFLGLAERGPLEPRLLTSFVDFVRLYGGPTQVDGSDAYLAWAIEGFFQNGGQRCVVARVAPAAATAGEALSGGWKLTPLGPGDWSRRLYYSIGVNRRQRGAYTLTLTLFNTATPSLDPLDPLQVEQTEVFSEVVNTQRLANYVERRVNGISILATITRRSARPPQPTTGLKPFAAGLPGDVIALADFTGNSDQPTDQKRSLAALADSHDVSVLCCPDEHRFFPAIASLLVAQAEQTKDRFVILQSELHPAGSPADWQPSGEGSRNAAFYYPWLNIADPTTGRLIAVPPGGHIAGIYARTDAESGVHNAPTNAVIHGIDSLSTAVSTRQQELLNPKGINVVRRLAGKGNLVWGTRTVSPDPEWKYINVRRLFIFVEQSLERGTAWVAFEPNTEPTWARIRNSVGNFLTGLWREGSLAGSTPRDAFFVKCDRTTMTQLDIDQGRLIIEVGMAPVQPAEFVIIRIGQWTGGRGGTDPP